MDSNWFCEYPMPPQGCPSIYPPKPPKPPKPKTILKPETDEICGNISQRCNGEFVEYWRGIGLCGLPSGSLTVINKSNCVMTVRADTDGDGISDITLFTITEFGQTKSVTVGSIANLEVSCTGNGSEQCNGSFCITLHYDREKVDDSTNC